MSVCTGVVCVNSGQSAIRSYVHAHLKLQRCVGLASVGSGLEFPPKLKLIFFFQNMNVLRHSTDFKGFSKKYKNPIEESNSPFIR